MVKKTLIADALPGGGAAASGVPVPPQHLRGVTNVRLVLAIAAVWIFWGSTFAGMHVAVQTIPPFVMAAIRFVLAGTILYAVSALRGHARVTRDDLMRATISGTTLLLLGNGMTAWTVQYLPTGINSLLLSLAPIWMAIIAFVWGGERPSRLAIAGMLLGFGGLTMLLVQRDAAGSVAAWPAALAVLASVSWAFGSVYQRRTGAAGDLVLATALQMLVGGVLIGAEAGIFGEWRNFDVHAVSAASVGGLAWLVVFGSLVGYSAYLYTMQHAAPALASTFAYVNPVVAVIIGMAVFRERFTPHEAFASAIIVCGVALMLRNGRRAALSSEFVRR